ncbi:MAG TPA: hypothetical protein VEI45_18280, partial [Mycobacterium sp.]|uniref:hypothetical protein n=1 Tax=Mycobacterium sp. TaxID=1785 RepID=UPI002D66061C
LELKTTFVTLGGSSRNRVRPVTLTARNALKLPVGDRIRYRRDHSKTEEALNLVQVQNRSDVYDTT